MQLKPITAIVVLLLLIASLLIVGCTKNQIPEPVSEPLNTTTTSASASATPSATPSATLSSTPSQLPTPTPVLKPQCNHVQIIIFHPYGVPCNHCAMMRGMLTQYYANNPYMAVSVQNATENSVVGIVRETGQAQGFEWANVNQIETWTDSVLTCK